MGEQRIIFKQQHNYKVKSGDKTWNEKKWSKNAKEGKKEGKD